MLSQLDLLPKSASGIFLLVSGNFQKYDDRPYPLVLHFCQIELFGLPDVLSFTASTTVAQEALTVRIPQSNIEDCKATRSELMAENFDDGSPK